MGIGPAGDAVGDTSGELTSNLATICDDALGKLTPGAARTAVLDVRAVLTGPLRLAVAGRVFAGKSTLVNALIGERLGQSVAGECTRLVAWFRYAEQERLVVHTKRGEPVPVPFADAHRVIPSEVVALAGEAQARLGRPLTVTEPADVDHLAVYLPNPFLQQVAIIDTPGLRDPDTEFSAECEVFASFDTATAGAVADADALIYLSPAAVRLDTRDFLQQFRGSFRGGNLSALNVVGVLSRADQMSDNLRDPLPDARRVANRYAKELRNVALDVLPVVGLLAETVETHALTDQDARNLEKLAPASETERMKLLLSAEFFLKGEAAPVDAPGRRRLMNLLGVFGLHTCFDAIAAGRGGVAQLEAALREVCGLAALREIVEHRFVRGAEAIKAGGALAKLERISYFKDEPDNGTALRALRRTLESVGLDPAMHQLEQIRGLQLVTNERLPISAEEHDELRRLALENQPPARLGLPADTPPDALIKAANERAGYWKGRENNVTDRHTQRVARMASTAHRLLAERLRTQAREPA